MQRLYIYIYIKMRFPRKYLLMASMWIHASPVSCYITSRYLARIKLYISRMFVSYVCVMEVENNVVWWKGGGSSFFLLFFSEVGFRGKWNVGWMKSVFVFRFMNLDNRVAFVWSLCDFFFSSFLCSLDAECSLLFSPMRCLNFTFYRCRVFFCRLVGCI